MDDAFYEQLGPGRFRSTGYTENPWGTKTQHLGPPTALIVRELEQRHPRPGAALCRITVEILGQVPIEDVSISTRVDRGGRSVELLSAELVVADRPAVRVSAWRMASRDTETITGGAPPALAPPAEAGTRHLPEGWGGGYVEAMDWWLLHGGPGTGGVVGWARQRLALVAGEEPSGLHRMLTVADAASGLSARLDIRRWLFINTELTVHLHRQPEGEWVGLDAGTIIGPTGVGLASSVLHDHAGPVARGAQSLLVRPHHD